MRKVRRRIEESKENDNGSAIRSEISPRIKKLFSLGEILSLHFLLTLKYEARFWLD